MFKLLTFLIVISLSGCTERQLFALRLNTQLDECAMKRMAETKINGDQGYLQAHHECHQIVMIQKLHDLHLERTDTPERNQRKDELDDYQYCWEYIKDIIIDKNYPELKLISYKDSWHKLTESENNENEVTLLFRKNVVPNKLSKLNKEKLIMVRDTMSLGYDYGRQTLCKPYKFHEIEAIIGRELHRRYPQGVDAHYAERFQ